MKKIILFAGFYQLIFCVSLNFHSYFMFCTFQFVFVHFGLICVFDFVCDISTYYHFWCNSIWQVAKAKLMSRAIHAYILFANNFVSMHVRASISCRNRLSNCLDHLKIYFPTYLRYSPMRIYL